MHRHIFPLPNKSITELSQKELDVFTSRLYPGCYSQVGFLGKNEDFLQIYKEDQELLQKLNITTTQIAAMIDVITSIIKIHIYPW